METTRSGFRCYCCYYCYSNCRYCYVTSQVLLRNNLPRFVHGSAAGYQDRSALLLLFPHFCGNMSAPRAIENEPMGVPDDAELKTPPAKRRGGVLSLSMGAAPRSGTTPASAEVHDVATPRQGRASSVSARKRRGATVGTLRALSAAPASISPPPMLSPGPDASMEELRAFCVTMLTQHDKALV